MQRVRAELAASAERQAVAVGPVAVLSTLWSRRPAVAIHPLHLMGSIAAQDGWPDMGLMMGASPLRRAAGLAFLLQDFSNLAETAPSDTVTRRAIRRFASPPLQLPSVEWKKLGLKATCTPISRI